PRTRSEGLVPAPLSLHRYLDRVETGLADDCVAGLRDPRSLSRTLFRGLLLLHVALAGAACRHETDRSWHQEDGYRWHALPVPLRGKPGFAALDAKRTGLTHRNDVADAHALANRNLLIGAGVAIGDIDGDGLPDVFLASVEQG